MSLPIAPGTYGIDTVHSQLGFAVKHLGISVVRGTFDRFAGALVVGETLADTVVTIEAEMASINSGNSMRDQHVQGAEFLDTANHPQMTFRTTSITDNADGYAMTGDLTIRGETHPVTLQATYNGSAVFPVDKSTHHGFVATGTISRSAYGVSYGVPMVSDEVPLTLDVQFVSPAVDA
jgi:polyisoprenoid-binding protein YceI